MPELTRRRSTDAREECWHVHYGDVLAGTIPIRNGNPHDEDPWDWHCGFYPGCHPGEPRPASRRPAPISKKHGRFFWRNEPRLTFRRGRDQQDWTARKYAIWQAGEKLPSQKPST